jgi:superfamily II DNA or RNA helicase
VELTPIGVRDAAEIERGIAGFARGSADGLIMVGPPSSVAHRDLIIALAAQHRLPAVYPAIYFVRAGGLISYGPEPTDQYRRAAGYVDRILKGEKPADLPVQAPTGSGKTLVAATIVEGALRKNNRLTFVVPAIQLIDQAVEMFYAEGIRDIGVIQADHAMTDWSKPVQVASIQTIRSRGKYPQCEVVCVDECHQLHAAHVKWMGRLSDPKKGEPAGIIGAAPGFESVPFIGLSATPWTKGLGRYFESLLVMSTTQELIDLGYLARFKVYAADHPNLSGVKILGGDYREDQLSSVMRENALVANIVETWRQRWNKDRTLVFGVDCSHAKTLQARFLEAGISAAYQDAHTPSAERKAIKKGFHDGTYRVVCNVGTLSVGIDWNVGALVLARPTKSEMLFVQIIGRALRTAPGKDFALILDHTATHERLGFVTSIHHDSLSMGKLDENKSVKRGPPLPKPCPQCTALLSPGVKVCPECGFERKIVSDIYEREGELVEFDGSFRKRGAATSNRLFPYTWQEKCKFYQQLRGYGLSKGYKDGWAFIKYMEKFNGEKPPWAWRNNPPMEPGPEVTMFVKSRFIAWAKGKRSA